MFNAQYALAKAIDSNTNCTGKQEFNFCFVCVSSVMDQLLRSNLKEEIEALLQDPDSKFLDKEFLAGLEKAKQLVLGANNDK